MSGHCRQPVGIAAGSPRAPASPRLCGEPDDAVGRGDVPPLERRGFRAAQPGHEEQPGDDAVDGRALGGVFGGLDPRPERRVRRRSAGLAATEFNGHAASRQGQHRARPAAPPGPPASRLMVVA